MNFAQQQRDPRKHLFGLSAVVVFHIVVYALANGLARKLVEVVKDPLSVNIIEEIKPVPPPPPPPKVVQVRPKVSTPPPAYVPTVEVPVVAPPAPVITTTSTPTPPPPPAPAAPVAPPAVNVAVACPNFRNVPPVMPAQAERQGLSGDVVVEFTVGTDGNVREIAVTRSTNAIFNAAASKAISQYRCVGQGKDVRVKQQISFRVDS